MNKLGKRDSISRQKDNGRNPGRSAIRGERCRGVAGGSAADTNDGAVHFPQAIDLANEHGHAEILEAAGVAYSAVFDPQLVHAEKLFAETLGPEEVGVSLEGGDDVIVVDLGEHPLLLAPDAGAVGPGGPADAGVEEGAPVLAVEALEGGHVVLHVEEAAGLGAVHDLIEGVGLRRGGVGVEGHVLGGEEVVVVGRIHAAGLVADVLVCRAALLGGGGVVLSDGGLGPDNEVGRGPGRGPFRGLERERKRLKESCGSH